MMNYHIDINQAARTAAWDWVGFVCVSQPSRAFTYTALSPHLSKKEFFSGLAVVMTRSACCLCGAGRMSGSVLRRAVPAHADADPLLCGFWYARACGAWVECTEEVNATMVRLFAAADSGPSRGLKASSHCDQCSYHLDCLMCGVDFSKQGRRTIDSLRRFLTNSRFCAASDDSYAPRTTVSCRAASMPAQRQPGLPSDCLARAEV